MTRIHTFVLWLAIGGLAALGLNTVAGGFTVEGPSMDPTLRDGAWGIIERISYMAGNPQNGDLIVFRHEDDNREYIKRIVAGPGDILEIKEGQVLVNGIVLSEEYATGPIYGAILPTLIPEDSYFVLGDNRPLSKDSRSFGPVRLTHIDGKVWIVLRNP